MLGAVGMTIKMYSTTWCPDCVRSKRTLHKLGVAYEEINIEKDPSAVALVRKINRGARSVPTIVFPDNSTLTEPNNQELTAKLKELGLVP
jgi:mycoredoxin